MVDCRCFLLLEISGETSAWEKKEFAGVSETESSMMSVYIMVPRDSLSLVLDMAITS